MAKNGKGGKGGGKKHEQPQASKQPVSQLGLSMLLTRERVGLGPSYTHHTFLKKT